MPSISALLPQPHTRARIAVYLDGAFGFTISQELVVQERLSIGTRLDEAQCGALQVADTLHLALQVAYRYLSYRPRSEAEVRTRLRKHSDSPVVIDAVVARLKEQRLLDDVQFAADYAGQRTQATPRSRRMVTWELRRKGVAAEVVEDAVEGLDDEAAAYRAALKRADRLRNLPFVEFRQKLGGFLQRRGFGYSISTRVVTRVWAEVTGADPEE